MQITLKARPLSQRCCLSKIEREGGGLNLEGVLSGGCSGCRQSGEQTNNCSLFLLDLLTKRRQAFAKEPKKRESEGSFTIVRISQLLCTLNLSCATTDWEGFKVELATTRAFIRIAWFETNQLLYLPMVEQCLIYSCLFWLLPLLFLTWDLFANFKTTISRNVVIIIIIVGLNRGRANFVMEWATTTGENNSSKDTYI